MNARNSSILKISLALTTLAMFGACASTDNNSGNSTGGSTPQATGGTSSGNGGSGGSSGTGAGGSSTTGGGNVVTFASGTAVGPMTGVGFVTMGVLDSVSDPTCGPDKTTISKTAACTTVTNWNVTDALCMTGIIPGLPASPVQKDYDDDWGLEIGVNTTEPNTQLGKTFTTVDLALSGSPMTGLRLELHRKGDVPETTYCAAYTGKPVALTDFNTKCWTDPTTVYLTAADVPNIDMVGFQVPSTSAAITVTNLCLKSITFGN